jgi:hypothetical protein
MSEVSFRLSQEGLTAYQLAVRDRLQVQTRQGFFDQPGVRWLLLTILAFALTLAVAGAIDHFLDRPMELPELIFGVLLGLGVMLATTWLHYFDQRQGLARADGPILSPQTMRLSVDGIGVQSKACDVRYRWAAVDAITEARGLVIFWIEPGAGLALPADAFATETARAQFIAEAEAFRSTAVAA